MEDADRSMVQLARWRWPAELLRLIAHPVRLTILSSLCDKPQCVKDINRLVPVLQPHLSQHMAALRQAQLVDFYTSGTLRCYYIIRPSLVQGLIALLQADYPKEKRDRLWVLRESQKTKTGKQGGRRAKKNLRAAVNLTT
jgi:ArsR family transcriptional regulator